MALCLSGSEMSHEELLGVDNRELLLKYRMVNNSIKEYGNGEGIISSNELIMLLEYREKLNNVIIEKMSYYKGRD